MSAEAARLASLVGGLCGWSQKQGQSEWVPAPSARDERTAERPGVSWRRRTARGVILAALLFAFGVHSLPAASPLNDRFLNRIALSGTNLVLTGSNLGASKESGEPDHAGNPGGQSVWWTWTAPSDGELQITTDGSGFDTLLGVYTGTRASALTVVASNDDHGWLDTSRVRLEVQSGTEYEIAVDGYNDGVTVASGTITLALTFLRGPLLRPPNDDFTNRTALHGLVVVTNGSNLQATREPDEPWHAQQLGDTSIWYAWTAPTAGVVKITTEGSSFTTLLAVYTGSSLTSLTEVASSDGFDLDAGFLASAVTFEVQAGQAFAIAVDGFDGASGSVALRIETVSIVLSAPRRLPDGTFQLAIIGASNRTYSVEASGDLRLWTEIGTVFNTNGTVVFTDPVARNLKRRFYRAVLW